MPSVIFWIALVFLLVVYTVYARIVYPEFEYWPFSLVWKALIQLIQKIKKP